jgi:hypothetical protein
MRLMIQPPRIATRIADSKEVACVMTVYEHLLAGSVAAGTGNAGLILTAVLTNAQEGPPPVTLTTTTGAPRPASFGKRCHDVYDVYRHYFQHRFHGIAEPRYQ